MACPKPAPSLTPAFKALLRRHHSCTGQTKAAAWLRKLFLWASEGDVRQPTGPILKRSSAAGRPAAASLWPVRSLPLLFAHGPRPQTFLQAAAWPRKLFLWASEGDVRDPRAPPSNPPRQPAGLPRPLCGLSEACPFSSPTGPARKRSCRPQLGPESLFYGPASSLRPRALPANVPAGRSLAQKAFSEGDVRDPRAPPSNPPRLPAGLPRPLCGLSEACPFSSPTGPARKRSCRPQLGPESFFYGLPTGDVRDPRAPPSNPPRRPLMTSMTSCRREQRRSI